MQKSITADLLSLLYADDVLGEVGRISHTVDAGNGADNDDISASRKEG